MSKHLRIRMPKKILYILTLPFIAGCATYADQQISKTKTAGGVLDRGIAYFCQHAGYATQESGAYLGGDQLSPLLGFREAQGVVLVRFKSLSRDEFSTEYLDRNLNISGSRHYLRGTDYQVADDGSIDIKTSSRCRSHDSPGVGCIWGKIKIFTDHADNLAVIQATDGAGIVGIIPFALSSKYLSLFPRVTPAAKALQANRIPCPERQTSKQAMQLQQQRVLPTFAVGDVVIPYRHYDPIRKEFLPGPTASVKNTKWLVQNITYEHVQLKLIAGEYRPADAKGASYRAGAFSTHFFSSDSYKTARPYAGNVGQIFEEFRKDYSMYIMINAAPTLESLADISPRRSRGQPILTP